MALSENTNALNPRRIMGKPSPIYLMEHVHAARESAVVCGWINAQAGFAALTVVNDADLYYNLHPDTRVMVVLICAGLNTVSDDIDFQLGYTSAVNAAGVFTPVMPYKRYGTGLNKENKLDYELAPPIPIPIRYSDGARCITFRVQANDAAAEVDLSWNAWVEDD